MISIEDINYILPEELIAIHPAHERDESRLLVVLKKEESIRDTAFPDVAGLINSGDCLVFNNTKVFKARLIGKSEQDKNIELLLVSRIDQYSWKAMVKNSKKIPAGTKVVFHTVEAEILDKIDEMRIVRFMKILSYEEINRIGEVPLPPYIIKKRRKEQEPLYQDEDEERYQSVLAEYFGSVAAPTASLHFTEKVLKKLKQKNVKSAFITLHVGPGTFKPIDTDKIEDYQIHEEWIEVPENTVGLLRETKKAGGRVIAVGTTVVRALETMARPSKSIDEWQAYEGGTRLFIRGEFEFKVIDALITNFHMPKSSLLLLVYAFGGKDLIQKAYRLAVQKKYRFLSYGDAMFIY